MWASQPKVRGTELLMFLLRTKQMFHLHKKNLYIIDI